MHRFFQGEVLGEGEEGLTLHYLKPKLSFSSIENLEDISTKSRYVHTYMFTRVHTQSSLLQDVQEQD